MNTRIYLLLLFLLPATICFGQRQPVYGPRKKVNIDAIKTSDILPGVVYIKLKEGYDTYLEGNRNRTEPAGILGISKLDAISKRLGAKNIAASFQKILKEGKNAAKHRGWALERWLTVTLPNGADLKEVLRAYNELTDIIEVAEPSYNRRLYDNDQPILSWYPSDSAFNNQWHFNHTAQQGPTNPAGIDADIDLPEAWQIETGKPSVIVAVFDGGIDTAHPDLRQNLWIGNDGTRFGINWYDYGNPIQPESHGTHVAGIIGAVNNNTIGVSGIAGGNGSPSSGIRLMNMQIFSGSGLYAGDAAAANAFVYAADHGASIAQNSWGGAESSNILNDAIDYFIINGGGTVMNGGIVFFSAGNNGIPEEKFPSSYSPVISVAATDYSDKKSPYSNYGLLTDISAPGGVNSTNISVLSTVVGGYGWKYGTSMACPHVSGVAALCISKAQGLLSNEQLRNILLSTADDIYPQNSSYIGMLGSGRVNAYNALQATLAASGNSVNPLNSFTASQDCGTVNISWTKNDLGNNVIIAKADTLVFGTPSGNLQVGDPIPGGGTIIYKGSGTSFSDIIPPEKRRYYRAWSYSGSLYSFHQTVAVIYSTMISGLTLSNGDGCEIETSWEDDLSCTNDSVLLVANKFSSFTKPTGVLQSGQLLPTGEKVIFKGKASSYSYTTDLDSNIFIKKWNFNGSHEYQDHPDDNSNFISKANAVLAVSATGTSSSQMMISWVPASYNNCFGGNNYMLAYSESGEFGNPSGTYTPGSSITGGGIVLYTGTNTSFNHTGLGELKVYCYKIWKVKNQSVYSFGKSACGETLCATGAITLPFHDGFEGSDESDPNPCIWKTENNTGQENAIKMITNGDAPPITPVEGNTMIRFNSFNISTGNTARLISTAIPKGSGKGLDIRFRWHQDSSNYTSQNYQGEGVMVQWSTNKTNWENLEFYPRVPVQGETGWSYKQLSLPALSFSTDTLYISFLFTSNYGNNCFLDDLTLQVSSYKPADNTTAVAVCEFTDSTNLYTHFYDSLGNRLLSIKKYGQDLGKAGQNGYELKLGPSGVSAIVPQNNYVSNPGGWISMNRYYSFHPLIEPVSKINIRYYYFTQDFNAISTASNSLLPPRTNVLHTNLYGWKANGTPGVYEENPVKGHAGIPKANVYNGDGFAQYANGSLPDTTAWQYRNLGNNLHRMEYITSRSGGGGLGIGSESGKGAFEIITFTFTGNGNWSNSANWENGNKPPAILPNNGYIIIDPVLSGECLLDVTQTIPAGASIKVQPGKKFRINHSLRIKN